ncbi:MAG TPA: ATP-binding protein [Planctomycetaceae bacterium]|nr:ATP-binding protein [Planctomycetaceae bacterium]
MTFPNFAPSQRQLPRTAELCGNARRNRMVKALPAGLPEGQANRVFQERLRDMNEALLLSSIHQHELAEQAQQSEAAMRESEHRYRALFDLVPVAVYACDAAGVIQQFNRRAVELWDREPALGDTEERFCGSFRLFRPDGSFMPHDQCPMAEVLSGKLAGVRDAEVLIERPDGARISVLVNIRPLKGPGGEVTGAINCFSDITQRSQLENKTKEQARSLADLGRRKDEFLAMLSHELRNPLAPILNAVQLLRLQRDRSPIQMEAHGMIDRQVAQLARLVDDLLEVSRVSMGRIHLQAEQVDLRGIVQRAIETTQPQCGQKGQSVAKSLPAQPIWVYGDPMRLEQVIVNLLNNASKYTERGGHIWVGLQQERDEAVLRVRDTGIGIAPELLPLIFDLFTQADKTLDRAQGGLGIGLSLVQSLVTMHDGRVEALSTLGQGSEFIVRLPVMASPEDFSTPAPADNQERPAHSLKVLVVDDNVDAAKGIARLLQAYGHESREAHEGAAAMQTALEYVPDVVLLDIGLPVITGYQVAKWIRQEPALKDVVLVALTGYGQESDRQLSQDAGFDHHLVKPVDFAKIETILSEVAGRT